MIVSKSKVAEENAANVQSKVTLKLEFRVPELCLIFFLNSSVLFHYSLSLSEEGNQFS
jgi:hypothetical protein